MRQEINKSRVNHAPNSLSGGCPFQAHINEGGFTSFPERVEAHKVRGRSASFLIISGKPDSLTAKPLKKSHIVKAVRFELGKVDITIIRVKMLGLLSQVMRNFLKK